MPEGIRKIPHSPVISCTGCYLEILFIWKLKNEIQMRIVMGKGSSSPGDLMLWRVGISVVNYNYRFE